jgi:hypothetical protein
VLNGTSNRLLIGLLTSGSLIVPAAASAERIQASLSGYEEVPSVSTGATGELTGMIAADDGSISYELHYSGLQAAVTMAHVHFAQPGVNGGIVFWLCGTASAPGPIGTPTCPQEGSVTGVVLPENVVATPPAQQVAAGDLAAVIAAMRAGTAYANVHTAVSPGGEIRGQIRASRRP